MMTATNKTGIPGVSFSKEKKKWDVRFENRYIARHEDFFEACCIRLSLEAYARKDARYV